MLKIKDEGGMDLTTSRHGSTIKKTIAKAITEKSVKDFGLTEQDLVLISQRAGDTDFIDENISIAENYDTVRSIKHLQKMLNSK